MCLNTTPELRRRTSVQRLRNSSVELRASVAARQSEQPYIYIIGAGAAGLACATKLLQIGFRHIYVFEAEKRIGGRIHTIPFADNVVDMGANFCHGESDNVVYELVKDFDLLDTSGEIFLKYQCIRSNGEVVRHKTTELLKNALSEIFANRRENTDHFKGSLGDYLVQEFNRALDEQPDLRHIDKKVANEFFQNFKKLESYDAAADLNEISLPGFNEYWECDGDYLLNWKDQGYQQLLQVLTKSQQNGDYGVLEDKIYTEMTVERLEWHREDGKVRILCKDQTKPFVADHVIITVSLGVLKRHATTMFVPPLPKEKLSVIENLGFGSTGRIYLEFREKFWPDCWTGFGTLWKKNDLVELRASQYAWIEAILGFYCVSYQPRVLNGLIIGKNMDYIESLSKEEVQASCMFLLRKFLIAWNIPDPVNIEISKWSTNPNFSGSHSFRPMRTEHTHANARQLAMPINILADVLMRRVDPELSESNESLLPLTIKPVLQFAGEATSIHSFSTVHGAIESGWREATRLAGYYSKDI